MRPVIVLSAILALACLTAAEGQDKKQDKIPNKTKLPVEGYDLPLDLTAGAKSATLDEFTVPAKLAPGGFAGKNNRAKPVAKAQDKKADDKKGDKVPDKTKLPVDKYDLPLDLTAGSKFFEFLKMKYDKDDNQLVFVVKTKAGFQQGGQLRFTFLDEDEVNLNKDNHPKFDPPLDRVTTGENTRIYLLLPGEDILKKTKKVVLR